MITGLDHVVIAVRDLERGVQAYQTLLGRSAVALGERDGVATAMIVLDNIAVELMAPVDAGEGARRLGAALDESGEGLKSLVFGVAGIERMHRRAERVGLQPEAIGDGARESMRWRSFRANTERTHGVRLFFIERDAALTVSAPSSESVPGLDHVVIRSGDMERAAALYGARLGLDMRLDREVAGRRLMFFRCGDVIVEIAQGDDAARDDAVWGLSWRVRSADSARDSLAKAGFDVSEVRAGMKPGTRVFTVRDGTCGVPTLMIEPGPKRD